jgi:hypothetical protein
MRTRVDASTKNNEIRVPGAKGPLSTEEPPVRVMTEKEYDMEQCEALLKNTLIQLAILSAIHWKWAVTVPLLSQVFMSPMKLYTSEVICFVT